SEESVCFFKRFAPENHPDNRKSTHKEIAEKLKEDLGVYCEEKINQTIRKVIEVLHKAYEEEMKADGVNTEALLNLRRGGTLKGKDDEESNKKFSPWKEVYNWLWNHKYLRWLDENGWKILQNKAKSDCPWIQFISAQEIASQTRIPKRPSPPPSAQKVPPTIPVNQPLSMVVDLAYPNYQLLLFNRSAEGQYLLCPSLSFAPKGLIDKPPILLPQKDSWADENQEWFTFEVLGEEEFLAIALEKPLNLDWLVPCDEDSLPECTGSRFKELFDKLEQQENCHVFYQSFEVVE
ncbi:MAG: hypothetical protein ACRCT1_01345, partial [Microcoleaceae cyanobacterium]